MTTLAEFSKPIFNIIARTIDTDNLASELAKMGAFCNDVFQDNFCFTPIEVNDFVQQYMRLKKLIIPKLVWLVEDNDGQLEAISFSIKDYNDPSGKQFIIKTLARRKESPFKKIGAFLRFSKKWAVVFNWKLQTTHSKK